MTDRYSKLAECMDCTPESVPKLIQQHAPWNGKAACDDALRERAAVVAWLQKVADAPEIYADEAIALRRASFAIERGEHHRREEEP